MTHRRSNDLNSVPIPKLWRMAAVILAVFLTFACQQAATDAESDPASDTTSDDAASAASTASGIAAAGGSSSDLISLAGSLNLTGASSSTTASLVGTETAATSFYMNCVTLGINDIQTCSAAVTDGGFQMDACEFKNRTFGCFIIQGDSVDGEIKGMVQSKDLYIPEGATNAELVIDFNEDTGVATVAVVVKTATNVEIDVSETAPPVAEELTNLALEAGNYEFKFCDTNRDKAMRGGHDKYGDQCNGHNEFLYVDFTEGDATTAPIIEVWQSQRNYDACHDTNGNLAYHIGDGTHSLSVSEETSFNDLFTAIKTNAWAPQAALDRIDLAEAKKAAKSEESKDKEMDCQAYIPLLTAIYDKIELKEQKKGRKAQCKELPEEFQGPPPEWCGDYKSAKTAEEKTALENRFIAECKAHVGGDEDQHAKQGIVEEFLRMLSEARHQNNEDDRSKTMRTLLEKVDISSTTTLNAADNADLKMLAAEWEKLEWDDRTKNSLGAIIENWATTGKSTFITTLTTGVEYPGKGTVFAAREKLFEIACQGGGEPDFSTIPANSTAVTDIVTCVQPQNQNVSIKTAGDCAGKTPTGLITALNDLLKPGCLKRMISHELNQNNQQFDPMQDLFATPDPNQQAPANLNDENAKRMLGWFFWSMTEMVLSSRVASFDLKVATGSAAVDFLIGLHQDFPMHFEWVRQPICQFDTTRTWSATDHEGNSMTVNCQEHGGNDHGGPPPEEALHWLKESISEIQARMAFRDQSFKEKMFEIMGNSQCLPDMGISFRPEIDDEGNLTIPLTLRSPVYRKFRSELTLMPTIVDSTATTAATEVKFQAEDARLETGFGEEFAECYRGEVTRISNVVFSDDGSFKGSYYQAFKDTCQGGGDDQDEGDDSNSEGDDEGPGGSPQLLKSQESDDSEEGEDDGWFADFKAIPQSKLEELKW